MLFHLTMTHTADNCPGYQREVMPEFIASAERLEGIAKDLNVKVHFLVWGAPDHVAYALIEADNMGAVGRYVNVLTLRQEFKVTPVQHLQDVVTTAKAMMAQWQK